MRRERTVQGRRPARIVVAIRAVRAAVRRERNDHPGVATLVLAAVVSVVAGAILAIIGVTVAGQLLAGLSLVPLSVAAWLRLLPPPTEEDEGDGGGGSGPGGGGGGRGGPSGGPGPGTDWVAFEREFWAYVEGTKPAMR